MSTPPLPRRGLLKSLAALVALPGAAPADEVPDDVGTAPDPAPDPGPASATFDFGQHWRITHDGDEWTAEAVARSKGGAKVTPSAVPLLVGGSPGTVGGRPESLQQQSEQQQQSGPAYGAPRGGRRC